MVQIVHSSSTDHRIFGNVGGSGRDVAAGGGAAEEEVGISDESVRCSRGRGRLAQVYRVDESSCFDEKMEGFWGEDDEGIMRADKYGVSEGRRGAYHATV